MPGHLLTYCKVAYPKKEFSLLMGGKKQNRVAGNHGQLPQETCQLAVLLSTALSVLKEWRRNHKGVNFGRVSAENPADTLTQPQLP